MKVKESGVRSGVRTSALASHLAYFFGIRQLCGKRQAPKRIKATGISCSALLCSAVAVRTTYHVLPLLYASERRHRYPIHRSGKLVCPPPRTSSVYILHTLRIALPREIDQPAHHGLKDGLHVEIRGIHLTRSSYRMIAPPPPLSSVPSIRS
jgi:hypothetical protein